jgi:cysteine synthase
MICASAVETVGGTPLVELSRLARGLRARIVGKLEMRNPAGSVKDRLGVALIEDAERRGVLKPRRQSCPDDRSGTSGLPRSVDDG